MPTSEYVVSGGMTMQAALNLLHMFDVLDDEFFFFISNKYIKILNLNNNEDNELLREAAEKHFWLRTSESFIVNHGKFIKMKKDDKNSIIDFECGFVFNGCEYGVVKHVKI
jgi:hypothetical protein